MSNKIEASTNCPYCVGYTDGSGFHHGINCPTLISNLLDNKFSIVITPNKEVRIIELLESIDFKLNRIQNELETIRMRTK